MHLEGLCIRRQLFLPANIQKQDKSYSYTENQSEKKSLNGNFVRQKLLFENSGKIDMVERY